MTRLWRPALVAVVGAVLLGGCATAARHPKPDAPIEYAAFKADPCSAYSSDEMRKVLAGALQHEGWPSMTGAHPQSRISAHVVRCEYRFTPKDSKLYGDQNLNVFVYNELNNGAKLMEACRKQPLAGAPIAQIGDESCVDNTGQWRFRVRDQYVSVFIDIPERMEAGEYVLTKSETSTFIAPSDPASRAGLGQPIAEDIARRLR